MSTFSACHGYGYKIADPSKTHTRTHTRYGNAHGITKYGEPRHLCFVTFTTTTTATSVAEMTAMVQHERAGIHIAATAMAAAPMTVPMTAAAAAAAVAETVAAAAATAATAETAVAAV